MPFGRIGLHQQIVYTNMKQIGNLDQQLVRPRLNAGFEIAVLPLCDANAICYFLLCKIMIFEQILDSISHQLTSNQKIT